MSRFRDVAVLAISCWLTVTAVVQGVSKTDSKSRVDCLDEFEDATVTAAFDTCYRNGGKPVAISDQAESIPAPQAPANDADAATMKKNDDAIYAFYKGKAEKLEPAELKTNVEQCVVDIAMGVLGLTKAEFNKKFPDLTATIKLAIGPDCQDSPSATGSSDGKLTEAQQAEQSQKWDKMNNSKAGKFLLKFIALFNSGYIKCFTDNIGDKTILPQVLCGKSGAEKSAIIADCLKTQLKSQPSAEELKAKKGKSIGPLGKFSSYLLNNFVCTDGRSRVKEYLKAYPIDALVKMFGWPFIALVHTVCNVLGWGNNLINSEFWQWLILGLPAIIIGGAVWAVAQAVMAVFTIVKTALYLPIKTVALFLKDDGGKKVASMLKTVQSAKKDKSNWPELYFDAFDLSRRKREGDLGADRLPTRLHFVPQPQPFQVNQGPVNWQLH